MTENDQQHHAMIGEKIVESHEKIDIMMSKIETVIANQSLILARFETIVQQLTSIAAAMTPHEDPRNTKQMMSIAVTLALSSIGFTIAVLGLIVQHVLTTR